MNKCGIGKLSGTECGSVIVKDTVINEYQALSGPLGNVDNA